MASQVPARWRGGRAEETWAAHYAALAGWAAAVTGDVDLAHRVASMAFVRLFSRGDAEGSRVTLYRVSLHHLDAGGHVRLSPGSRWRNGARLLWMAGLTAEEASLVLHRPERALAAVFDRFDLEELGRAGDQLGARADAELEVDVAQVELHGLGADEERGGDLPVAEALPHQSTGRQLLRSERSARR